LDTVVGVVVVVVVTFPTEGVVGINIVSVIFDGNGVGAVVCTMTGAGVGAVLAKPTSSTVKSPEALLLMYKPTITMLAIDNGDAATIHINNFFIHRLGYRINDVVFVEEIELLLVLARNPHSMFLPCEE
jgi:hypothetical protein